MNKYSVHEDYILRWRDIDNSAFLHTDHGSMTDARLTYTTFFKVWATSFPTRKICNRGTDYCDTCKSLTKCISNIQDIFAIAEIEEILRINRKVADYE